jgi:hypothetical protein
VWPLRVSELVILRGFFPEGCRHTVTKMVQAGSRTLTEMVLFEFQVPG